MRLPPFRQASSSAGNTASALRSSALAAWMPPTRGPANRSRTSLPRRLPTSSPTEWSCVLEASPGRAGTTRSRAARARPTIETIPDRARGRMRVGTPSTSPSGRGRSAPFAHTEAVELPGETRASSIPSSLHSSTASGLRAKKASAPRSTTRPPTVADRRWPPSREEASRTTIRVPGGADDDSSHAADRPVIPPPMTATVAPPGPAGPAGPSGPSGPPALTALTAFTASRRLPRAPPLRGSQRGGGRRRARGCARSEGRPARPRRPLRRRGRRGPRGARTRSRPGTRPPL